MNVYADELKRAGPHRRHRDETWFPVCRVSPSVHPHDAKHQCVPSCRDDQGRTPLHWAAEFGLAGLAEALAAAYAASAAKAAEASAAVAAAAAAAGAPPEEIAAMGGGALPPAAEAQDRQGLTPLHAAARGGHCAALAVILTGGASWLTCLTIQTLHPQGRQDSCHSIASHDGPAARGNDMRVDFAS